MNNSINLGLKFITLKNSFEFFGNSIPVFDKTITFDSPELSKFFFRVLQDFCC